MLTQNFEHYPILLWIIYFLGTLFFFMYAVDFNLSFKDILELFIFSTIALSIPLVPAGLGTYEGIVVLILSHHGVSKENALISASIYHTLLFIVDFVLLYIFLFVKDLKLKDLTKK